MVGALLGGIGALAWFYGGFPHWIAAGLSAFVGVIGAAAGTAFRAVYVGSRRTVSVRPSAAT